jgi:hypothetical protein
MQGLRMCGHPNKEVIGGWSGGWLVISIDDLLEIADDFLCSFDEWRVGGVF